MIVRHGGRLGHGEQGFKEDGLLQHRVPCASAEPLLATGCCDQAELRSVILVSSGTGQEGDLVHTICHLHHSLTRVFKILCIVCWSIEVEKLLAWRIAVYASSESTFAEPNQHEAGGSFLDMVKQNDPGWIQAPRLWQLTFRSSM